MQSHIPSPQIASSRRLIPPHNGFFCFPACIAVPFCMVLLQADVPVIQLPFSFQKRAGRQVGNIPKLEGNKIIPMHFRQTVNKETTTSPRAQLAALSMAAMGPSCSMLAWPQAVTAVPRPCWLFSSAPAAFGSPPG